MDLGAHDAPGTPPAERDPRVTQGPARPGYGYPNGSGYAAGTPNVPNTTPVAAEPVSMRDRVRWGPIWAGLITTLPTFLILEFLAYGIGLGQASTGVNAWVTGILVLISFFIGGWVTGRTSAVRGSGAGLINGFLVWGLGVTLILAASLLGAGQLFGALGNAFGGTRGAVNGGSVYVSAGQARMAAWGVFLSLVVSAAAAMLGAWLGSLGNPVGRFSRTR